MATLAQLYWADAVACDESSTFARSWVNGNTRLLPSLANWVGEPFVYVPLYREWLTTEPYID